MSEKKQVKNKKVNEISQQRHKNQYTIAQGKDKKKVKPRINQIITKVGERTEARK